MNTHNTRNKHDTTLCVMQVWQAEEKQQQQQPNDKFIYDFCLTCLEAFLLLLFTLSQLHGNFPRKTITVFTYRSHHPVPQRNIENGKTAVSQRREQMCHIKTKYCPLHNDFHFKDAFHSEGRESSNKTNEQMFI